MTPTKSLSERLREFSVVVYNPDGSQGTFHPPICTEAADALDQKDVEIERLRGHKEEADRHIKTIALLRTEIERLRVDATVSPDILADRIREATRNAVAKVDAKVLDDLDRATRNRGARVAT